MNVEFTKYIKLQLGDESSECRLHVRLGGNQCRMSLESDKHSLTIEDYNYTHALISLLQNLSTDASLIFTNKIYGRINGKRQVIEVNEQVKLYYLENDQEYILEFELSYDRNGERCVASSKEDFGIALMKVIRSFEFSLEICASCKNSDFKSDGGEDLRQGWYCFRELDHTRMNDPWYEREELFELAIPHKDAFYWCPAFTSSEKVFA